MKQSWYWVMLGDEYMGFIIPLCLLLYMFEIFRKNVFLNEIEMILKREMKWIVEAIKQQIP